MAFLERFKELRKEKSVTISKLSREIGISRFAIMKWEKGETRPTMEVQKRLCEFFNVSADYLMGISDIRVSNNDGLDPFIVDLSQYSPSLNDEQKKLILELTKQIYFSNKK